MASASLSFEPCVAYCLSTEQTASPHPLLSFIAPKVVGAPICCSIAYSEATAEFGSSSWLGAFHSWPSSESNQETSEVN